MILQMAILIGGLGVGYIFKEIMLRRSGRAYNLYRQLKAGKPIAFLETDKGVWYSPILKIYKNLAITDRKEVVIVPKDTMKPVLNLGGSMVAHGDLYKSVTTPQELRKTVKNLTDDGWSKEEIAEFFEEIETTPPKRLKGLYGLKHKIKEKLGKLSKEDKEGLKQEIQGKGKITEEDRIALKYLNNPDSKEFEKYKVYLNLPSTVRDFILTGINRTTIHSMLREMVYQRELERAGARDWVKIGIAAVLIAVAVGLAVRFIFSTPGIMSALAGAGKGAAAGGTQAPRVAP